MQFYSLVVAGVDPETHDVRRDFVREARTREYFLEHGHEARGVRLFVRGPGAGRRDFCDVLAHRSRLRVIIVGATRVLPPRCGALSTHPRTSM